MIQIQNKNLANKEVNFEHVGIVKADDSGIFDISNDEVAQDVVKAIKGFRIFIAPSKPKTVEVQEVVEVKTTAAPKTTAKTTTATSEKPVEVEPTASEKK